MEKNIKEFKKMQRERKSIGKRIEEELDIEITEMALCMVSQGYDRLGVALILTHLRDMAIFGTSLEAPFFIMNLKIDWGAINKQWKG